MSYCNCRSSSFKWLLLLCPVSASVKWLVSFTNIHLRDSRCGLFPSYCCGLPTRYLGKQASQSLWFFFSTWDKPNLVRKYPIIQPCRLHSERGHLNSYLFLIEQRLEGGFDRVDSGLGLVVAGYQQNVRLAKWSVKWWWWSFEGWVRKCSVTISQLSCDCVLMCL